jgi:hypothetical protein
MAAWQAAPVRVSATPLPVAAVAPAAPNAPPPPARVAESAATRAHPFAELLRQSRDEGMAQAAPHERTLPIAPDEDTRASDEPDPPSRPDAPVKAKPRLATTTAPKVAGASAPTEDGSAERVRGESDLAVSSDVGAPGTAMSADAHGDTWIAQALAGATPVATNERADGTRHRAGNADADSRSELVLAGRETQNSRTSARTNARIDAENARTTARAPVGADADPRTPMLAAEFVDSIGAGDAVGHRPGAEIRVDALAPALAAGASSPTGEARGAGAPPELLLPTPIDSPDFGAAFGVQVSMLAKDGVQQAELHLNPAETGPVSIQIALDGNEARIDFGADLAATRVAIERSLPELAAALRDAGLTLTGGGVSQHAGGRGSSSGDEGSPSARASSHPSAADRAAPVLPATRRVVAGGVDLYA